MRSIALGSTSTVGHAAPHDATLSLWRRLPSLPYRPPQAQGGDAVGRRGWFTLRRRSARFESHACGRLHRPSVGMRPVCTCDIFRNPGRHPHRRVLAVLSHRPESPSASQRATLANPVVEGISPRTAKDKRQSAARVLTVDNGLTGGRGWMSAAACRARPAAQPSTRRQPATGAAAAAASKVPAAAAVAARHTARNAASLSSRAAPHLSSTGEKSTRPSLSPP